MYVFDRLIEPHNSVWASSQQYVLQESKLLQQSTLPLTFNLFAITLAVSDNNRLYHVALQQRINDFRLVGVYSIVSVSLKPGAFVIFPLQNAPWREGAGDKQPVQLASLFGERLKEAKSLILGLKRSLVTKSSDLKLTQIHKFAFYYIWLFHRFNRWFCVLDNFLSFSFQYRWSSFA